MIDHYETPQNVGSFDKKDTAVGSGAHPLCCPFKISEPSDHMRSERKHGFPAKPVPVSSYDGSWEDPKSLNRN